VVCFAKTGIDKGNACRRDILVGRCLQLTQYLERDVSVSEPSVRLGYGCYIQEPVRERATQVSNSASACCTIPFASKDAPRSHCAGMKFGSSSRIPRNCSIASSKRRAKCKIRPSATLTIKASGSSCRAFLISWLHLAVPAPLEKARTSGGLLHIVDSTRSLARIGPVTMSGAMPSPMSLASDHRYGITGRKFGGTKNGRPGRTRTSDLFRVNLPRFGKRRA